MCDPCVKKKEEKKLLKDKKRLQKKTLQAIDNKLNIIEIGHYVLANIP